MALASAAKEAFIFIAVRMDQILRKHQQPPPQPSSPSDYFGNFTAELAPLAGNQTLVIAQEQVLGATLLTARSSFENFAVLSQTSTKDEMMLSLFGQPHPCSSENSGMMQRVVFERDGQGNVVRLSLPGLSWGTYFVKD